MRWGWSKWVSGWMSFVFFHDAYRSLTMSSSFPNLVAVLTEEEVSLHTPSDICWQDETHKKQTSKTQTEANRGLGRSKQTNKQTNTRTAFNSTHSNSLSHSLTHSLTHKPPRQQLPESELTLIKVVRCQSIKGVQKHTQPVQSHGRVWRVLHEKQRRKAQHDASVANHVGHKEKDVRGGFSHVWRWEFFFFFFFLSRCGWNSDLRVFDPLFVLALCACACVSWGLRHSAHSNFFAGAGPPGGQMRTTTICISIWMLVNKVSFIVLEK